MWNPNRDTHRGRLRIDIVRDTKGAQVGVKLVLSQKQSKKDHSGERDFEKGFVIDQDSNALSSGMALWQMQRNDPEVGREEETPPFCNLPSGAEVTYE